MKIILFQPEIPQNTGNIARTCAVTGTQLTLVRPLGFNLSQKQIKRSGMDYWGDVELNILDQLDDYLDEDSFFFSTKGTKPYTQVPFTDQTKLIFGSESAGLPHRFHENYPERFYTIPMLPQARSLNLSNAVAVVLYEALRQQNFNALASKCGIS